MLCSAVMTPPARPAGITFLALFFVLGAAMSGLTTFLLLFPGTAADVVWRLNPRAHAAFLSRPHPAVILMLFVCAACVVAALGLWKLNIWGLRTALVLLVGNMVGDLTNAILSHDWRTLTGVPVACAMAAYLLIEYKRSFVEPSTSTFVEDKVTKE